MPSAERRSREHQYVSGACWAALCVGSAALGLVAGAGAGLGLSAVEGTAVGGEGRRALGVRARRPSQGDLRSAIDPDIEGGAGVVQQWVEQAAAGHNPWLRVGLLAAGGRPGLADRWGGCGGCWPEWLVADLRGGSAWGRSVSQGSRDGVVIRTPDRRLRVFVSSTLGELAEERRAVSRAISALRLTPVMFEAGARPYAPAEVYQQYLAQSDVFIGLYWQRYGQLVPGGQVSGLEDEFDLSGRLPRLLYVKAPAPEREPRLADLLARIKEESSTSYRYFRTPAELGRLVRDDLAVLLSERFAAGGRAAATAPSGGRGSHLLPVSTTSLLGRERAID